jgi:uncharacterized Zn finger protein (UPF0148 family)
MPSQVTNYQCPSCTGPLHFSAEKGKLVCDFCGSEFEVAAIEALYAEKDEKAAAVSAAEEKKKKKKNPKTAPDGSPLAGHGVNEAGWQQGDAGVPWSEEEAAGLRAYNCPSCGAELICDETTAATSCPYCGNPTVVPGQLTGSLKPDYVIPFKLEKKDAIAALKKYYRGKRFLPKAFTSKNHIDEIQGVYVPFWLFDGVTDANISFEGTISHTHREGDYEVTRTEYFEARREGTVTFEKVPVDGSSKMPDEHMDAIEPFDYSELKPFSTAYLPGYLADKYDVNEKASQKRADRRIKNSTETALRNTVHGYSAVTINHSDVRIQRGTVKYAMLPVWTLHTSWQGKHFLFAMNGQTGKLIGDLPASKGRMTAWGVGVFAVTAAVLGVLAHLLGLI